MKSSSKKPIVLFDIDDAMFNTATFIQSGRLKYGNYEEVKRVLESLSNFVTLGIFSEGEYAFQKVKLEKTGILKFFKEEDIHIFQGKDNNLIQAINKYKGSRIFLVDDRLTVLASAKKNAQQVSTIWVRRGRYADAQKEIEGFIPDSTILNLKELIGIIESNIPNYAKKS